MRRGTLARLAVLGAALVTAACAGGRPAGYYPPTQGGGRGLPETRAVARADFIVPPGRRDIGMAVRAYALDPRTNAVVELDGAVCAVEAGPFRATLATPGRLIMQDLGPDAPPVTATCSGGGLRGSGGVQPDWTWAEGGGNTAQRFSWGGGWWYGGWRSGPVRYPDLAVTMAPVPQG
jgi:hypothetical protein